MNQTAIAAITPGFVPQSTCPPALRGRPPIDSGVFFEDRQVQNIDVVNAGGGSVTISSIALRYPTAPYSSTTGTTCAAGTVLGPGQSCVLSILRTNCISKNDSWVRVIANVGGTSVTAFWYLRYAEGVCG